MYNWGIIMLKHLEAALTWGFVTIALVLLALLALAVIQPFVWPMD